MYFMDTNTCIYFLKNKFPSLSKKWLSLKPNQIKVPSIVKAELLVGAYKSKDKKRTLEIVEKFLEPYEIIPFTNDMVYEYTSIRTDLENKGQIIGPNDLLIATIVKSNDGILITNNEKEFSRVKKLKLKNWINQD